MKNEVLNKIFSKTNSGIKLGLERMLSAAKELGDPHKRFKVVHVAGTNGKGSVCTFAEAALRASGYKTGLYTSPHLIDFNERFKINGISCTDEDWLSVYNEISDVCEKNDLTFFEISTLIAFVIFAKENVDYAIIETGLGGRLDATNIVDPEISIITKIGIDHTAYLGDDIESIAKEKLGIIKCKRSVVMQLPDEPVIINMAEKIAEEKECQLTFVKDPKKELALTLKGEFQQLNVCTVLTALDKIGVNENFNIIEAIKKATLPGRFDKRIINGREFLFDVSHNPQAVDKFIQCVKDESLQNKFIFVVGLMKDKDTSHIVNKYCEVTGNIIFTKPDTPRSESPENLAQMVDGSMVQVSTTNNVIEAIDKALSHTGNICVTGSFFTVGEAMAYLGITI